MAQRLLFRGLVRRNPPPSSELRVTPGRWPDPPAIVERLRSEGYVVVRGGGATEADFARIFGSFTRRFVRDYRPERPEHGDEIGLHAVDVGSAELSPHFELGVTNDQPDVVAFLCVRPARRGGHTLVYDGVRLYRALRPQTRRYLEQRDVLFRVLCPREFWLHASGLTSRGSLEADIRAFRAVAPVADNVDYSFWGSLLAVHTRRPIVVPHGVPPFEPLVGACLFANYAGLHVSFGDGEPIPPWPLQELESACASIRTIVEWTPGDMLFIDNRRCMHGRSAFDDRTRSIVTAMAEADLFHPTFADHLRPHAAG